jgi:tRNA U34 5-methylaminomethyl-2-thiouridine-forming methyltransferase MnmC
VSEHTDYTLVRLRNGTFSIRSQAYGETMHPGIGPEAEADALYVRQTGLLHRLTTHRGDFVIWDVGLGAAANALTVLARTQAVPTRIRLLSFDNTDAPLRFALKHHHALDYLSSRHVVLQRLLSERRIQFSDGQRFVDWELFLDDFPKLLCTAGAQEWPKPHLILFDPFSPAANPAMWTLPLFQRLFALLDSSKACLLPTYSRSTMLRVTLLLAGFFVGCGEATGRKEETTLAANTAEFITRPLDERWLERVRRSDSAHPLIEPVYRKAFISAAMWERLRSHRQFQR